MWVSLNMAFKLTYTDGQESDYDDETKWEVEGGVLKLGRDDGQWSVYVSPGHWATIEVGKSGGDTKKKKHTKDDEDDDKSEKEEKEEKDDD